MAKVLLLAERGTLVKSLPGSFTPVFWSPVWFTGQGAATMGILCDPKHPALADFPTEFHSDWQWFHLLQNSRALILDGMPAGTRPLVQVIDNYERAHRLGVVRVASTDTVRQVMRAFFSAELMPAIHFSSFDCAGAVRFPVPEQTDLSRAGFIEQAKAVAVGVEAVVSRAVQEKQSTIIEGVHLVPGFLDRRRWKDALVIELVMAVSGSRRHRSHFTARDWQTGGVRPLRKYVAHFREIRRIQDYILAKARESGVLVIDNDSIDDAVNEAMTEVLHAVSELGE